MRLIKENSLVLLLVLGTSFTCYWVFKHRNELKTNCWTSIIIGILHTLIGLLFVKLFAVMETLDFSSFEGMSLFGGMFFMPVVYFLGAHIFKKNTAKVFDIFTPCIVFTIMCARINCLFSGCCMGLQISGTSFRYPTREIEILFYILLLMCFMLRENKMKKSGVMYPIYLMAYGIFRFICEFFRSSESGYLFHISHVWALISVFVGYAFLAELNNKINKQKTKK